MIQTDYHVRIKLSNVVKDPTDLLYAIPKIPAPDQKYRLLDLIKTIDGHEYIIIDPYGCETKGFSALIKSDLVAKLKKTLDRLNSNNQRTEQENKSGKKGIIDMKQTGGNAQKWRLKRI